MDQEKVWPISDCHLLESSPWRLVEYQARAFDLKNLPPLPQICCFEGTNTEWSNLRNEGLLNKNTSVFTYNTYQTFHIILLFGNKLSCVLTGY